MKHQFNLLPGTDAMASTRGNGARWLTPAHLAAAARRDRQLHEYAMRQAIAQVCRILGDGIGAIASQLAVWHDHARMRRHLTHMDERLLRDIGLSPLDAKREINKPFWRE